MSVPPAPAVLLEHMPEYREAVEAFAAWMFTSVVGPLPANPHPDKSEARRAWDAGWVYACTPAPEPKPPIADEDGMYASGDHPQAWRRSKTGFATGVVHDLRPPAINPEDPIPPELFRDGKDW